MRGNRFTIYDALSKAGYFDSNPANTFSYNKVTGESLFKGAIEFPKMLYHPQGEEKVIVPGVWEVDKAGRQAYVGEQREIINMIVNDAGEEATATADGWHDHPAKAIRARVDLIIDQNPDISEMEKIKLRKSIPAFSSTTRIADLEKELLRLQGQLAEQNKSQEAEKAAQVGAPTPAKAKPTENALAKSA